MKKVLIITASGRKGGNSETLAPEFGRGARAAGHQVEMISLRDKAIGYCKGCLSCHKTMRCLITDEAESILHKMLGSDMIVFASPIYFFEMSGQMKTVIDRTNPPYPADYTFRDVYLAATAADTDAHAMEGSIKGLQGWIECFDKTALKGVISVTGVTDVGDIQESSELERAYGMGKAV